MVQNRDNISLVLQHFNNCNDWNCITVSQTYLSSYLYSYCATIYSSISSMTKGLQFVFMGTNCSILQYIQSIYKRKYCWLVHLLVNNKKRNIVLEERCFQKEISCKSFIDYIWKWEQKYSIRKMKLAGTAIFTFCIFFSGLYTSSIATNLNGIQRTTSWTTNRFAIDLLNKSSLAKSYNHNDHGSDDYETDYFYGMFILNK